MDRDQLAFPYLSRMALQGMTVRREPLALPVSRVRKGRKASQHFSKPIRAIRAIRVRKVFKVSLAVKVRKALRRISKPILAIRAIRVCKD